MKIHSTQRVLCICRNGQVRSVAARFLLSDLFGFRKVVCIGWELNDYETLDELCKWADVIMVVGRPSDWGLYVPKDKTINIEIGEDIYGHYLHPRLLEVLLPKITAIVEPVPQENNLALCHGAYKE